MIRIVNANDMKSVWSWKKICKKKNNKYGKTIILSFPGLMGLGFWIKNYFSILQFCIAHPQTHVPSSSDKNIY